MDRHTKKRQVLGVRHRRVRRKVAGTATRPRLSVSRSLKHIEAQLVDDVSQRSLIGLSSQSRAIQGLFDGVTGKIEKSKLVGRAIAERALESGIRQVVFDRGGHRYHGRIKALADGAREGGLEF